MLTEHIREFCMCHQALFRVPREGLGTRLGMIHVQPIIRATTGCMHGKRGILQLEGRREGGGEGQGKEV